MKSATAARDAGWSGQKRPPPQPEVMPSANARSISANCGCPGGTSVKLAAAGGARGRPRARTRKTTAWPLVVLQSGQKRRGLALQPEVTPAAWSASAGSSAK